MADEDLYRRRRAYELRAGGASVDSICLELKCDDKFVKKWFDRGSSGHGFHDSQRSGRPRTVPEDLYPKVRRLLKRKRGGSAGDVAKTLSKENNIQITERGLENYAHELGLSSYVRPKKARLVKDDKPRRIRFAKKPKRPKYMWGKIFWTDEKAIPLHLEPRLIWAESRDDVPPREKDLVEPTVRVWGGISAQGRTPLFKIPTYWTATDYSQFLKTKALPSIRKMVGDDFIFMHDGDGAHRGKVVEKLFQDEGVQLLPDCPARSPDLWPHENMWKIMDDGIMKHNYTTLDGLWKVAQKEWNKVLEETVRKLALDVPNRLKEVIERGGGVSRH